MTNPKPSSSLLPASPVSSGSYGNPNGADNAAAPGAPEENATFSSSTSLVDHMTLRAVRPVRMPLELQRPSLWPQQASFQGLPAHHACSFDADGIPSTTKQLTNRGSPRTNLLDIIDSVLGLLDEDEPFDDYDDVAFLSPVLPAMRQ